MKLLADGLGVAPAAPQSEMSDGPAMQETTTDESADTRPDPRETVPGQETGSDGEKESVVATPTERPAPMDADTHAGKRSRAAWCPPEGVSAVHRTEHPYKE